MTIKFLIPAVLLSALILSGSCKKDDPKLNNVTVTEDFESGANQWQALFGSYPEGEEEFYELTSGVEALPQPLDATHKAFKLSGNNHSDALRMFMVKQFDGFEPSQAYVLNIKLKLASMYPANSMGIGGGPGTAVHLVALASANGYEKKYSDDQFSSGYFDIELIKDALDNKAQSEVEMGTVAIEGDDFVYQLIERSNAEPLICNANEQGKITVIIGTWSGFEGITTLYYDEVIIEFTVKSMLKE